MAAGIKYMLSAESRLLSSKSSHCSFFRSVRMVWLTFPCKKSQEWIDIFRRYARLYISPSTI